MKKTICAIGGGRWGKNHIKTLAGLGCLAAIVEPVPEKLQELLRQYPGVKGYTDIDEAIAAGYDGYTVATPAETHYSIGKKLIAQGLNVLMEKPMTLTAAQSKELVELAEKTGSRLMVGHVLLFHSAYRKIKEIIDSGKLGQLFYLYSNRLNLGTVRTEESVFSSFAPHDISLLDYLTGSSARSIEAKGGQFLTKGVCDTTLTLLEYPDNVKAHIFVSWLHPYKQQLLVVVGSKGMLSFDDSTAEKEIHFYNKSIDFENGIPVKVENPDEIIPYERKMPLEEELNYFAEHLDSTIEINDGKAGYEVVRILETVQKIVENNGK
jgi:UDP-2-acetamido-3-amino-2,3-dideoxy-glucuronate N-acetyltransferase